MKILILLTALVLAFGACGQETKVYKKVNEDGSITYTDEAPEDGTEAMDLPQLQVVPPYRKPAPTTPPSTDEPVADSEGPSYDDLRLVSPEPDQNFWGTGGNMTVSLSTASRLKSGHSVNYYLDGDLIGSGPSMNQTLTGVVRGQHTIKADIVDAQGRVKASVGPVIFHMKQQSSQNRGSRR